MYRFTYDDIEMSVSSLFTTNKAKFPQTNVLGALSGNKFAYLNIYDSETANIINLAVRCVDVQGVNEML